MQKINKNKYQNEVKKNILKIIMKIALKFLGFILHKSCFLKIFF